MGKTHIFKGSNQFSEIMDFNEFFAYLIEEEHKSIDQLLDKIETDELKVEISDGETIGDRFAHMALAEFMMAKYLFPDEHSTLEISDKEDKEELKRAFNISKEQHLKTIKNLQPTDLDKEWVSQKTGNRYSYKYLLYHFFEHLATHRGQIAMRLRQIRE
ncbi:MAG: DinB family protein [Methanobacteriota archaeon]|nr:MAG: DinB family protein [Euryarchaeota archaeon]